MTYKLRDYQQGACDAAIEFFNDTSTQENAIIVLPTGAGKSLVISEIANRLNANVLVFQPSKEILEQNLAKMQNYTDDCSAYSASAGKKKISKVTFATIGSVKNKVEQFKHFDYVIIDECHLVNGEEGMYKTFLTELGKKVLGLTATPFRLYSATEYDITTRTMRCTDTKLVVLTNDENRFFSRIIYKVQVAELLERGYLANIKYFDCKPNGWNEAKIFKNSTGSDYSTSSVQWMMEHTDHLHHLISVCRRLLYPKNGIPRKAILVFVQFVDDAREFCTMVSGSDYICGETSKKNRERIIDDFKTGKIKILVNVNTLTCGFDFPELDTVVLARPTLSLAMMYQQIGRVIRPCENKDAWVVDTVGNVRRFGQVANLRLERAKATGTDEMFGWVYDYDLGKYNWKALTGS